MVVRARPVLALLPEAPSVGEAARAHQVSSVRALLASIEAREHHRRFCGDYGVLGQLQGATVAAEDGFRQPTGSGLIEIRHNLEPSAFVTYDCLVEYVGLRVNETNETYDEPYVIFSVVTLNPNYGGVDELASVTKIGPLDSIEEGQVLGDTQTVWQGFVAGTGIKVTAGAFEQDLGDPDEVRATIEAKIKEYAQKAATAIASAYGAGGDQAAQIAGSELVTWMARIFSLGVVELFGLGDDEIGRQTIEIPLSEVTRLSTQEGFTSALQTNAEGLQFTHKLDIRSSEGDYSVYFRVRGRQIPPVPFFPDLPHR